VYFHRHVGLIGQAIYGEMAVPRLAGHMNMLLI